MRRAEGLRGTGWRTGACRHRAAVAWQSREAAAIPSKDCRGAGRTRLRYAKRAVLFGLGGRLDAWDEIAMTHPRGRPVEHVKVQQNLDRTRPQSQQRKS